MRVTLDWDDDGEMRDNIEQARRAFSDKPWELRQSSSGDGWHFIGYEGANDTATGFENMMNLRKAWGDDPKRRKLDRKRWKLGSPFMQVLYRKKYMDRTDWPTEDSGYSTGLTAEVIEQSTGVKAAPESEKIKTDSGSLNYLKILRLMYDRMGTQAAVADRLERARSTVSEYLNEPDRLRSLKSSSTPKRRLKRWARSQGIGHYASTDDGGKAAEDVRYIEDGEMRRTLVEYVDVPMDWDIGGEDREYGLLNIHTGSYNDKHTDQQIHRIHDGEGQGAGKEKPKSKRGVADQALAVLSPSHDGKSLNLDADNRNFAGISGWTRELDSMNYEREFLDPGEDEVYIDNLPDKPQKPENPGNYPLFEVILWDENMQDMEWHVIGLWTGSTVGDATILRDVGIGDWDAA